MQIAGAHVKLEKGIRNPMRCRVTPIRGLKSKVCLAVLLGSLPTFAQDAPPELPPELAAEPVPAPESPAPELPPEAPSVRIETRTYTVTIEKRSASGRIYKAVRQDSQTPPPPLGATLLFRSGTAAVMAFRVLKIYDDALGLAIKKIKEYPGQAQLEPGQVFEALEKTGESAMGDAPAPPPPLDPSAEAKLDESDLKELEQAPAETKTATAEPANTDESSSISELDLDSMSVNELRRLDTDSNWVTAQVGLISALNPEGLATQVTAFGLRYATTLSRDLVFRTASVQDSLCLELSTYFYKQVGTSDDTYTVMPLNANFRYNLFAGETVGLFVYAGFAKSFVLQANNPLLEALDFQSSFGVNAGLGFLYVMGPKWNLRFDYGIDMIGAGLVIRF